MREGDEAGEGEAGEARLAAAASWFLPRVLGAGRDGSALYGGPARSLALLLPVRAARPRTRPSHTAIPRRQVLVPRVGADRVTCVELHETWPETRSFLTGTADGCVRHWSVVAHGADVKVSPLSAHDIHSRDKEEVIGLGYSGEDFAISVGIFGVIVKWNLSSNVARSYSSLLKSFKPTSMACSPHAPLTVAIGTKQGVLFVIDLKENGKLLYKVRGHDDEITGLTWCPQAQVTVKKLHKFSIVSRMEKIRNPPKPEIEIQENTDITKDNGETVPNHSETGDSMKTGNNSKVVETEDDMFDIYKDPEDNEFGHKKFQPEEIAVPVNKSKDKSDFLSECMKLKSDIIDLKNKPEESIQSLVKSLENGAINGNNKEDKEKVNGKANRKSPQSSVHSQDEGSETSSIHRHLLVSIEKHGKICMWSKSGQVVASAAVPCVRNKQDRAVSQVGALHWRAAGSLLIADGKNNLLECDPLTLDGSSKLTWKVIHTLHKRTILCIASAAPRRQAADTQCADYPVWTVSQDRKMVLFSIGNKALVQEYETFGGFVYMIAPCPYDAQKMAIGAGDGRIRVWEMGCDGTQFTQNRVAVYWQNVQGKVMTVAWHPTRENRLAFGTAEGRVGLLDTSSGHVRVLCTALRKGVYSVCWGDNNQLFACGEDQLFVYAVNPKQMDAMPELLSVELEGKQWHPREVAWFESGLCVGGRDGEVGVLTPRAPHTVLAAGFLFQKPVHCIAWHPQDVSLSEEPSPCSTWIAASSTDKHVLVLDFVRGESSHKLNKIAKLEGHTGPVVRVVWSPHRNGQLLSTSQDATVRVWDAKAGVCTSVFDGHSLSSLAGAWCAQPALADYVVSGGCDYCVCRWNINDYPLHLYEAKIKSKAQNAPLAMAKSTDCNSAENEKNAKVPAKMDEDLMAVRSSGQSRQSRSSYAFPLSKKQQKKGGMAGCRRVLRDYLTRQKLQSNVQCENDHDTDYVKLFGTTDEFNHLMDLEQQNHLSFDNLEAWIVVGVMRGEIEKVFQMAINKNILTSFLISIAPVVSHRFWKDVMQSYVAQMDRMHAEKIENEPKWSYGGHVFRKMMTQLSLHGALAAVDTLAEASMFREAYVLARVRHMEQVATELLDKWAAWCYRSGDRTLSATIYIVLGKLVEAGTVLSKSKDQEHLLLATEIAKITGQDTLAESLINKMEEIKISDRNNTDELLATLPERLALHLQERAAKLVANGGQKSVDGGEVPANKGEIVGDGGGLSANKEKTFPNRGEMCVEAENAAVNDASEMTVLESQ